MTENDSETVNIASIRAGINDAAETAKQRGVLVSQVVIPASHLEL